MTMSQRNPLALPSLCMAWTRVVANSSFSRTDIWGSSSSHNCWYSVVRYCNNTSHCLMTSGRHESYNWCISTHNWNFADITAKLLEEEWYIDWHISKLVFCCQVPQQSKSQPNYSRNTWWLINLCTSTHNWWWQFIVRNFADVRHKNERRRRNPPSN